MMLIEAGRGGKNPYRLTFPTFLIKQWQWLRGCMVGLGEVYSSGFPTPRRLPYWVGRNLGGDFAFSS